MNERLKKIRTALNLTQEEFGEKIGIKSRAHISALESGKRTITDRIISDICREFSVNEEWLRDGIDPIFIPTANDELKQLAQKYNFNDIEYKFLYEYLKLDLNKRQALVEFLENILNSNASLATKETVEDISDDSNKLSTIDYEVEAYRKELEAESKGAISSALEKPKGA